MFVTIFGAVFGSVVNFLMRFAAVRANVDIERIRADTTNRQTAANVVIAGMAHPAFWVAWSIAAVPLSAWFGWGVLDSMLWNGTVLPDVATLPPQLKEYGDVVWGNIFYAGGAVAVGSSVAKAVIARNYNRKP